MALPHISKRSLTWLALAISCLVPISAIAEPIPDGLVRTIKSFQIDESSLTDGTLRVRFKKSVVTREVYESFVYAVCGRIYIDPKGGWGKARIDRIETINSIGAQGFAFVGGRKSCADLGQMVQGQKQEREYMEKHTWVCVAGNPCRERRAGDQ